MPDYSSLTSQINQFKTAASALMTSDALNANELQLVGAALNAMANTLGVADINNSIVNGIATINTNRDAAITAFQGSTNGTRLTNVENDVSIIKGKTANIEGFVSTNSAQYTNLQSTVNALQTSVSTVPSAWKASDVNILAVNGDRIFATTAGITVTLPFSPSIGFTIRVVDGSGIAGNSVGNNIVVGRNSERINAAQLDLRININGAGVELIYVNAVRGWSIV